MTTVINVPPSLDDATFVGHAVTICSQPLVTWIRKGKAYDDRDAERARVRKIVLESKGIRTGVF